MRHGDKLMIVGAVYAMYLLIFVAFGVEVTGVWSDMAVSFLLVLMGWYLGRRGERELRPFFALLTVSFAFNLVNLAVLNKPLFVPATGWSAVVGSNQVPLSFVYFGLFLFCWNCAWLYHSVALVRRQGAGLAHWLALFVLIGFVGAYVEQYRSFDMNLLDAGERFSMLLFALELIGILLGVMCILLGVGRAYLFMIMGFTLFAAIDIVAIDLRLHKHPSEASLQPLWALGHLLLFTGAWLLITPGARAGVGTRAWLQITPGARAGAGAAPGLGARPETAGRVSEGRRYSQLSSLLIVFSLGAVFVVAGVERLLEGSTEWFAMFFVLFCTSCAIVMSLATSRFDQAINYVRDQIAEIFQSKLAFTRASDGESEFRRTLQITGLDVTLQEIRRAASALRNDVIVLGPERLNRPPAPRSARTEPRCFIVMPFSTPESAAVDRLIRAVCESRGVQAVRGDDIFSPTDILDDIWLQIMSADFVIADVSGRNTNVFYELGMAHAVCKPVVILSRSEADVPIDLKTRRWIPYDLERSEEFVDRLDKCVAEVLEKYSLAVASDGKRGGAPGLVPAATAAGGAAAANGDAGARAAGAAGSAASVSASAANGDAAARAAG